MSERALRPASLLVDAVRAIEESRRRIAVVTNADGLLLGTLTDGDIRRCLLAGGSLDTPVSEAMNPSPVSAEVGSSDAYILDLLRGANVMALPLVDETGRFQRLVHITDLEQRDEGEGEDLDDARGFAFAVIMAGGEGTRLRPLTDKIPKPMVDIGGVPMLERQIERLARARVPRVYLSVNYLSHLIEEHFGDGADFGIEIRYIREEEPLGTAGALSLLPERAAAPIIMMNGDILTTSDFGSLYAFHKTYDAYITVAAVDYRVNIPYGVISSEGPFVTALAEKPSQRFLCNAGIYVLSPDCLALVERATYTNITDLIELCLARRLPVAVFPVHEYWTDIGTPDDLEKARALFSTVLQTK